jgi:hypothetical protein
MSASAGRYIKKKFSKRGTLKRADYDGKIYNRNARADGSLLLRRRGSKERELMNRTVIILTIIGISTVALAQPSPKPTPVITSALCVNNSTGAIRDALNKNGVFQGCKKTEQQIGIVNLESAPSPAPTDIATPNPSASASPGGNDVPHIVDANGKDVGPLLTTNSPYDDTVLIIVNGIGLGIPYDADGFISQNTQGLSETVWYTSTNCSGVGYLTLYEAPQPNNDMPLIEVNAGQEAPYVFNEIAYYAVPPFSNQTFNSIQSFTDPTKPSNGGCNPLMTPETFMAGTISSFNLGSLDLTPPFSVSDQ